MSCDNRVAIKVANIPINNVALDINACQDIVVFFYTVVINVQAHTPCMKILNSASFLIILSIPVSSIVLQTNYISVCTVTKPRADFDKF